VTNNSIIKRLGQEKAIFSSTHSLILLGKYKINDGSAGKPFNAHEPMQVIKEILEKSVGAF